MPADVAATSKVTLEDENRSSPEERPRAARRWGLIAVLLGSALLFWASGSTGKLHYLYRRCVYPGLADAPVPTNFTGTWYVWDENGNLFSTASYRQGKIVFGDFPSIYGGRMQVKLVKETGLTEIQESDRAGNLRELRRCRSSDLSDYADQFLYFQDATYEFHFASGLLEGTCTLKDSSGHVHARGTYHAGRLISGQPIPPRVNGEH